eukprot:scaffold86258_cov24-Phaeocystis_antarctica.AAC.1
MQCTVPTLSRTLTLTLSLTGETFALQLQQRAPEAPDGGLHRKEHWVRVNSCWRCSANPP